ncbi:pirin family protein [Paremcibacter congregatus]|uniref:pirin family protein n=1 Tax=Paremcibacter congregatus TaxID=2043170 RepID=UPI003A8D0EBD
MSKVRQITTISSGQAASDGAGVKLTRLMGAGEVKHLDPFLLMDNFESDNPNDYIGGFPEHPHRGFETVTYLLAGRMRHKDNAGHEGVINPGDVQWMTAGRGILHSEMPEQQHGLLRGFQFWVNLPARDKMTAPRYQEYAANSIPKENLTSGGTVKVISGRTDQGTEGPVRGVATAPIFFDVTLPEGASFSQSLPESHNGFIYMVAGQVEIGSDLLGERHLGILGDGDLVHVTAGDKGARFLLLGGQRIEEPIARSGPFVMNTEEEIRQAYQDYRAGRFLGED